MAPAQDEGPHHYKVLGRLSSGGMAEIFLARVEGGGGIVRHVVLKRVLAERAHDPNVVKMFLDEARLVVQLRHPNIAQVFDIGRVSGAYFFTMEYVHGVDVRSLMQRLSALRRPLPVNLAMHVAMCALGALHHAHDKVGLDGSPLDIVHRDVSPANIMVSFEGVVKLLDFGVAKANQREAESRSGVMKGKIAYLSPEQIQGQPLDRRSDIFSMGIVLHEMLTGRRLFRRDSDFETMRAIVQEAPSSPSTLRDDLPPEIDHVVLRALTKDRELRYPTAAAMAEDIEPIAAKHYLRMSATAMSKFMLELYGVCPEPWEEMRTREEAKAVTVDSQLVIAIEPTKSTDVLTGSIEAYDPVTASALYALPDPTDDVVEPPPPAPQPQPVVPTDQQTEPERPLPPRLPLVTDTTELPTERVPKSKPIPIPRDPAQSPFLDNDETEVDESDGPFAQAPATELEITHADLVASRVVEATRRAVAKSEKRAAATSPFQESQASATDIYISLTPAAQPTPLTRSAPFADAPISTSDMITNPMEPITKPAPVVEPPTLRRPSTPPPIPATPPPTPPIPAPPNIPKTSPSAILAIASEKPAREAAPSTLVVEPLEMTRDRAAYKLPSSKALQVTLLVVSAAVAFFVVWIIYQLL